MGNTEQESNFFARCHPFSHTHAYSNIPPGSPDGLVANPQTAGQVKMLELPAALGHLLHSRVGDIGVDGHRERTQCGPVRRPVTHSLVSQLPAGGEVQCTQLRAVIRQAVQCQVIHPLAVSQAQVLQAGAAKCHSHQSVASEMNAAVQVHALQLLVLTNHRKQLLISDPVTAAVYREALEDFIITQHETKSFLRNSRTCLRAEKESR